MGGFFDTVGLAVKIVGDLEVKISMIDGVRAAEKCPFDAPIFVDRQLLMQVHHCLSPVRVGRSGASRDPDRLVDFR